MLRITIRTFILLTTLVVLQACSWFKDKPPEYVDAQEAPPVRVPEDLDAPRYRSPIAIAHPDMRMPSGDELNPGPPRVAATAGQGDANAYMAWSAEGVYLFVKDTQSSVERRLRFAIERSGMQMLDADQSGHYRFEYQHIVPDQRSFWKKLAFWSGNDGPNYSGIYRTRVDADGENARVYLLFDSGESATTNSAEHVLGIFMERLG